ncbi:MAG: hypothetical protein HOV86_15095 [Thermoactinospora sp.]|nr:hypothetical protein [Thermoactinospora sp.]
MNTLSRRAVLTGGALLVSGCAASVPEPVASPAPDPETVLLQRLVADKERTIALYRAHVDSGGEVLRPFLDRHLAHLTQLRSRLPQTLATTPASPSPSASASAQRVSLTRLRDIERKAAAQRTRDLADASASLSQLIASIGACEAAHAVALPRSL